MRDTPATMLTMTTYGTWLRGDARGWVDHGVIYPPNLALEAADRALMSHPPFLFDVEQLAQVGEWIGRALVDRLGQHIWAITVQTWHVHLVIGATQKELGRVVKCAKDAVRWGLAPGRPIWSQRYDKRFCFDSASVARRVRYVERHNVRLGWPTRPWSFIEEAPGVAGVPGT
jgi:hypothetical protein